MFPAITNDYSKRLKATHLVLLFGAALLFGAPGCSNDDQNASACVTDTECKADRICSEQGRCVYPDNDDEDASVADAGPEDTGPEDVGPEDTGPADTGPDDAGNDVTEDAPTADADDARGDADTANDGGTSDADVSQDAGSADAGDTGQAPSECDAYPNVAICIEVEWEAAAGGPENGRDIDLHYLHPLGRWNEAPFDIFWDNTSSDWNGDALPDGDPTLVLDAMAGPGPEVITHGNPQDDTIYSVGVYYYQSRGLGPAPVTMRIYIDGQMRYETATPLVLDNRDFAEMVAISWPSQQISVIERVNEGFPN